MIYVDYISIKLRKKGSHEWGRGEEGPFRWGKSHRGQRAGRTAEVAVMITKQSL